MTAINQGSFHDQLGMTAINHRSFYGQLEMATINQGSFHGQLGMTSIHDESLHALWGIHLGMTQGLLTRMVAYSAPADLRGRAYGFFNLMSDIALLIVSTVAGLLWTGIYVLCGSRVLCYYACGSSLATNSRKIKTVTVS